jgi:very-short-patch-repair endonuclease
VEHPKEATNFFPLPYNDEQLEIIGRLDAADGVVVQGPPGTGKTHTIANILCHYMATGKRVLVTAKTPEALRALREKLPEGVADLAIAVIHNDREGARQLQRAVGVLANEAKQLNVRQAEAEVVEKQGRVAKLREEIKRVDGELLQYATRNLSEVTFRGEKLLPMELATRVAAERGRHPWLEDKLTLDERFEPAFGDAEVSEIERLRATLERDILYQRSDLPRRAELPELPRILAAHGELARIGEIERRTATGAVPLMLFEGEAAIDEARATKAWLEDFAERFEEVRAESWLLKIYHTLLGRHRVDEAALALLRSAFEDWTRLYRRGRDLTVMGIAFGDESLDDDAFNRALTELAGGRKPFGLFAFGKSEVKRRIEKIQIEGRSPLSPGDWRVIVEYRGWRRSTRAFAARWSNIARGLGVPGLPEDPATALSEFFRIGRLIETVRRFADEVEVRAAALSRLFPYGLDPKEALHHGRCGAVLEALSINLERADLVEAQALKERVLSLIGNTALPFHAGLADVVGCLGSTDVTQTALAEAWQAIFKDASRLEVLRPVRGRLDELAVKIARSGAEIWARRLASEPAESGHDLLTPSDWRSGWEWARADGFVRELDERRRIAGLTAKRAELEQEEKRHFGDVVRLRTFIGLKRSLTDKIEAALQKFMTAIARLGRGTGKTAPRQRRIIRDAAMEAAGAVPCWILPEWRVSEQLPPELGAFDLVVIDEASQSDITALPSILRGKKVLIVGDDKQVSPSAVGMEDRKITQLRSTYLEGLPFGDQMDPATSLYELGSMVFPGKTILLREHFRCVEPIIRFSSRFYDNLLVPLRIPKASERLDPPLIDFYVRRGNRQGDVNRMEADVIVREIGAIVRDPANAKRTIGVISLIGEAQAKHIYGRLVRELGVEAMERHRIMCGNSATFQGQERDIMFLSMVADKNSARAQTTRIFEQRFNVALSRARDRMVLVRSVAASDLKPGDLKLAVIEHFRNPMGNGQIAPTKEILARCDSGFERDFGGRLLDLGYRLRAQVPVGGRRIDFVIEGADDRRLAVELDGDKYHGPDRWADDVRRQKALERLGWTFWRCWGSSWVADPNSCLDELRATLGRLGIEPLGAEPAEGVVTLHVEEPSSAEFSPQSTGAASGAVAQEPVRPAKPAASTQQGAAPATAAPRSPAEEPTFFAPPEPAAIASANGHGYFVEAGDTVVIRYSDQLNRPIVIRLSPDKHDPDNGVVHVGQPLARAVLGCGVDDEIEVPIGGKSRKAVVERIEKAVQAPSSRHDP